MAKWSRPPAASLIAFSSLSPFITHNFIKIPPHLSLPLSPLLLPSLSLSRLTTITVSLFSYEAPQDWTSFITSTLMYFFLLPPSVPPSSACCSRLFFWELCCCFSCILSHFLCFSLSLRWHAIRHCYTHSFIRSGSITLWKNITYE